VSFHELEYEGQEFKCHTDSEGEYYKGRTYKVKKSHDGDLYLTQEDGACRFGAPKEYLKK